MNFRKTKLNQLLLLGALFPVFSAVIANGDDGISDKTITTNVTISVKGTHFPRSPKWNNKISVYETNLFWSASGKPFYHFRNRIVIKSSDKLFSQEDFQTEQFVEDSYDRGDICTHKGKSTIKRKFDKPNNRYPWKTSRSFSEKTIYEGPAAEYPGINLKAGRTLSEFGGLTNAWSKQEYCHSDILLTYANTNITDNASKRYHSIVIESRKDSRKAGILKEKYGITEILTKQDSYPQEVDYIRKKIILDVEDKGNGNIKVTGSQNGRVIYVKESQCKVLSDWDLFKQGRIHTPFPSSVRRY